MLRYESNNHLKSLRDIIGLYSAHGLRDKKPLLNETKIMRGGNTINIVIGTDEPEVVPFKLYCDRRGIDICFDKNNMKVILLVRYEGVILEGSNVQDRNNDYLSEIVN